MGGSVEHALRVVQPRDKGVYKLLVENCSPEFSVCSLWLNGLPWQRDSGGILRRGD